ncbi:protein FAM135A-like isoform X2 [Tachypleus tridentatus]|uniref:protein FAM135A-like isoform X2 n=1 Tax=Tachypleus tridentatus TaxID=6853 RepID=UPI003FD600C2
MWTFFNEGKVFIVHNLSSFYQVRTYLRVSPKLPAKVEVSLPKNSSCDLVFPACVVNGTAVGKTFQILYKDEEVLLNDLIVFKVHLLVDGYKVHDTFMKGEFKLIVELWFTDQNFGPDQHNSIECVSTRTLELHLDPAKGLHHHLPVLFEYFHLSAITVTIHASLLALCQPYLRKGAFIASQSSSLQRPSKTQWLGSPRPTTKRFVSPSSLESVLFGYSSSRALSSAARIQRGKIVHWELCRLLLSAYNGLQRKFIEYLKLLPVWEQQQVESVDSAVHLENLSDFAKVRKCYKFVKSRSNHTWTSSREQLAACKANIETEEDLLVLANSDVAQLCGALIVLWQQFLEVVVNQERIRQHLAQEHHQQRVKHFSEAFFLIKKPLMSALSCDDFSYQSYLDVTEMLKRSQYLSLLPPVEVECVDLDGDSNSLPVIFEEHYMELTRRFSHSSCSSQSTISLSDLNFLVEDMEKSPNPCPSSEPSNSPNVLNSPDFFSLSSSPSVLSWNSEPTPSPVSKTQMYFPARKVSCGEKSLTNIKSDFESSHDEYIVSDESLSKKGSKLNLRSKMKLKARTSNLLKQLKKPHSNNGNKSQVFPGFKKLDLNKNGNANNLQTLRAFFPLCGLIRHAQSTLSVTAYNEPMSSLTVSESMPDLSLTPFPPPPQFKSRYTPSDSNSANLLVNQFSSAPAAAFYKPLSRERSQLGPKTSFLPPINCYDKRSSQLEKNNSRHSSPKRIRPKPTFDNLRTQTLSSENRKHQVSRTRLNNQDKKLKGRPINLSETREVTSEEQIKEEKNTSQTYMEKLVNTEFAEHQENNLEPHQYQNGILDGEIINQTDPPSPPVEFRDPPGILDKSKSENDLLDDKDNNLFISCATTDTLNITKHFKNNIFIPSRGESYLSNLDTQGTVFFPKPPALFSEGHCCQKTNTSAAEKETKVLSKDFVRSSSVPEPATYVSRDLVKYRMKNNNNRKMLTPPTKHATAHSCELDIIKNQPPALPPKSRMSSSFCSEVDKKNAEYKTLELSEKNKTQKNEEPQNRTIKNLDLKSKNNKQLSDALSYPESKSKILDMLIDLPQTHKKPLTSLSNGVTRRSDVSLCEIQVGEHCQSQNVLPSTGLKEDLPKASTGSAVGLEMISFVKAKEEFRKHLNQPWLWYSDFSTYASSVPYFQCDNDLRAFSSEGIHLVVCVHGLDGNNADLRLVKTYMELGLPTVNFEFIMSERNQGETFGDFEVMTDRLVSEITYHIEVSGLIPAKISFIGHSLGNIIIRSALTRPEMKPYLNSLHTFLSLSGPHLGTLYNSSGLVNMGMWFMQKWKKSGSLLQLGMRDAADLQETFLYKLSKKPGLEYFKNVLLFGSSQDRYVPSHSARIELCKTAVKDTSVQGAVYREMVKNILQPILDKPHVNFIRYEVHHALPSNPNSLIGRTAHIAVLDSELFIEKFLVVCGLKYFS